MSGKLSEHTRLRRDLEDLENKYKRLKETLGKLIDEREDLKEKLQLLSEGGVDYE